MYYTIENFNFFRISKGSWYTICSLNSCIFYPCKSKFGSEADRTEYESAEDVEEVDVENDTVMSKEQQLLWPAWVYCTRYVL